MQAGIFASAHGRSGRHYRYVALSAALLVTNGWLWFRFIESTSGGNPIGAGDSALAITAGIASLLAIASLWRKPMTRNAAALMTPSLRHALATHRAGHLVAMHIVDRGRVATTNLNDSCRNHRGATPPVTHTALRSELVMILSGMTAEEILNGETGTYSADDVAKATAIATRMVGNFGMSGSLVSFKVSSTNKKQLAQQVLDDPRARKELEALLRDAKREATRLMLENRHVIITLRDALLRHRQLDRGRIRQLIEVAETVDRAEDAVLVDLRSVSSNRPMVDVI